MERKQGLVVPFMQQLSEASQMWEAAVAPFVQVLNDLSEFFSPYVLAFVKYHKIVESFDATGWLPYHFAPFHYVEECDEDIPLLGRRLSDYYRTQWDKIHLDIESRLESYHIDEEARKTFREALSAHKVEHYRCVCRVLFPEIERMIRFNLFDDAGRIGSRSMVEKLTNERPLEEFSPREAFGFVLFGRLARHLYEEVKDEERGKFEKDSVPNRHAAMHGFVPYSTHKNSVNMIIMADYIFQILPPATTSPSRPAMILPTLGIRPPETRPETPRLRGLGTPRA